jgi:hypothetical protein
MRVVSAEGSLQFGHSVSCAIVDEAHVFTTQKQADLWEAMETALHKRLDSFLLAITRRSERASLLGRLHESSLASLSLEQPADCLTVGRDEENGVKKPVDLQATYSGEDIVAVNNANMRSHDLPGLGLSPPPSSP